MKETNIDSMKYRKSTHLASIDVETIVADKGNCILTIKEAYYDTGVDVSGKKTSGYFIEFVENVKPMMANSGNRKIIGNIVKALKNCTSTESRNISNWTGLQIELTFDPKVTFGNKIVGGIVILEKYDLPELIKDSVNFNKCKTAIEKSGFTIEQIKAKYKVSKEVEQLLTGK